MIALIRRLRELTENDRELAWLLDGLSPHRPDRSAAVRASKRTGTPSHADGETVFSAGQSAFEHGDQQSSCPYGEGDASRAVWLAGWDEARRFDERTRLVLSRRGVSGPDGGGDRA